MHRYVHFGADTCVCAWTRTSVVTELNGNNDTVQTACISARVPTRQPFYGHYTAHLVKGHSHWVQCRHAWISMQCEYHCSRLQRHVRDDRCNGCKMVAVLCHYFIRLHCSTTELWTIATGRVARSVCLSVGRSVFHSHLCKNGWTLSRKGKQRKSIYIALFWPRWYTQSAQAWITQFYLQTTPCLPFLREHSPHHHHSNWGSGHPNAAHYSFMDPERMKGWVGLVSWPIADGLLT